MLFHRAKLLDLLYHRLPDRETRVYTRKEVTGISKHVTGVTVTCADGTKHQGSIVLGADGTHSVVRRLMNNEPVMREPSTPIPDPVIFSTPISTSTTSLSGDNTINHDELHIASLTHHHISPDYMIHDIWSKATWSHMADLEEGVINGDWYDTKDGRVVLAGDAVHKMTPNAGLGLNEGVQDAVALVNCVWSLLASNITCKAREGTGAGTGTGSEP